jgi:hypothetical protein
VVPYRITRLMKSEKTAHIQWLGSLARVYDSATPARTLFEVEVTRKDLIVRIQTMAADLGYCTPQIYAGEDGITRIWL